MPFGRPFRAISLCVSFPRAEAPAEALGCFLFARRALGTRIRKCPNSRGKARRLTYVSKPSRLTSFTSASTKCLEPCR